VIFPATTGWRGRGLRPVPALCADLSESGAAPSPGRCHDCLRTAQDRPIAQRWASGSPPSSASRPAASASRRTTEEARFTGPRRGHRRPGGRHVRYPSARAFHRQTRPAVLAPGCAGWHLVLGTGRAAGYGKAGIARCLPCAWAIRIFGGLRCSRSPPGSSSRRCWAAATVSPRRGVEGSGRGRDRWRWPPSGWSCPGTLRFFSPTPSPPAVSRLRYLEALAGALGDRHSRRVWHHARRLLAAVYADVVLSILMAIVGAFGV